MSPVGIASKNEIKPADIDLLKVNNGDTRMTCQICSKLALKTPERRQ